MKRAVLSESTLDTEKHIPGPHDAKIAQNVAANVRYFSREEAGGARKGNSIDSPDVVKDKLNLNYGIWY